jgi:hypothetical protein
MNTRITFALYDVMTNRHLGEHTIESELKGSIYYYYNQCSVLRTLINDAVYRHLFVEEMANGNYYIILYAELI